MQPELPTPLEPQSDIPYPTDYLNQIAAPEKKPGINNRLLFILIGIAALIIGLFGFLMLSSSVPKTADLQSLAVKMPGLQEIASDAQKKLKSSNLRSVNSSLILYFTNTNRDLQKVLVSSNIKLNKEASDASITKMEETLENARISDLFDKTYADEMKDQLSRIDILINSAYKKTNSKSIRAFLETTSKDLESFYNQLSDFSSPSP
ncbi:MAG: hypothetical protein ACSLEY_03400 [Candidatus Saccharimonadales bacterium]